ncbi:MAG: peptidoglycan recognition family protein [Candidatus Paceibacterota bacterium]
MTKNAKQYKPLLRDLFPRIVLQLENNEVIKIRKQFTVLIIALLLICLIGITGAINATSFQLTKEEMINKYHSYHQVAPVPRPTVTVPPSLVELKRPSANQAELIIKKQRPYYYLKTEVDPEPYIEATLAEKRNLWFVSKGSYWYIDWDAERLPFEIVVIHHSEGPSNVTVAEINQGCKESLYARRYASGNNDPYVKGLEPHSGHMINGQESFLPYHYIVYPDGTIKKGLNALTSINGVWYVDQVGWHAGNWEVNCKSLSILLIGDYSNATPPSAQLKAVKKIITGLKFFNPNLEVAPHYQFNSQTNCPGWPFEQWQSKIS